ncbi:unnamed protein product [Effrenium voratum]|uniref:Aspartyl/asparaginy/proline hydroxylase domain-containing protein n=1 Tax=Effrenium voratum TaxID=2562239 RepID=A0AA36MZN1_9DINO|nr:unnamed protein product [Effrenium voratum]CAJ1431657.1 unnamed protein product [Effrenium voratum]
MLASRLFRSHAWFLPLVSCADGVSEIENCIFNLVECLNLVSDDEVQQEALATKLLQSWLQSASAQEEDNGPLRAAALAHVMDLAEAASSHPVLALGVGQALHSFFWWGVRPQPQPSSKLAPPDVQVARAALTLHEQAVTFAGCDIIDLELDTFLARKCPWRWRFAFLIGSELGLELALAQQDFAAAAATFSHLHARFGSLHLTLVLVMNGRDVNRQRLPHFAGSKQRSPMRLNQNWDFFPAADQYPIWPRNRWPPFGEFVERHYDIFKAGLEAFLQDDPGRHFGAAARFQSGLTPRSQDWARIKLIHSGGQSELCKLPYLKRSCELLADRPEIGPRCGTYLSGASIARLLPSAQLKPHLGTHPRLTLQLGLRAPSGATLTVAGEEVAWTEGKVIIFDDTYMHKVQHRGEETRYVLVAWFCHPCDNGWRQGQGEQWLAENPLPEWCGGGGGGYSAPPVPGYSEPI